MSISWLPRVTTVFQNVTTKENKGKKYLSVLFLIANYESTTTSIKFSGEEKPYIIASDDREQHKVSK
jgi:hypothetical protein